ncbi:Alcohol dehydrogenase [NADP(+)] [Dimargaris xerosporica]|nr:Alcohol dehydrogenase [NADP(+)] [Dimargaris xerosporica]
MASQRAFTLYTGAKMPAVGLGTWRSESQQVINAIKTAYGLGYRHFDCAMVYENEHEVGEGFTNCNLARDKVFITSKLWNTEHQPDRVPEACETTLKALKCQYLDLYLMHWPLAFVKDSSKPVTSVKDANGHPVLDSKVTLADTWKAMETLVEEGKTRHIGVCNFTVNQLKQLLSSCKIKPAVVQIEIHPYCPNEEMIEFCKHHGIHVTAYSPLGSMGEPRVRDDPVVQEVAKSTGRTPAQVLLAWGVQRGTSVIPKSVHIERLKENFDDTFTLSQADMDKLSSISTRARFCDVRGIWGLPKDALFDN